MPNCSIKSCGARKSKNQPHLTLHSIPKNEVKRRKWLNAIGLENINPLHKTPFICSLHFEESHFNKTLDKNRLRDDAVPTLFNTPSTSQFVPVLCDRGNVNKEPVAASSHPQECLAPAHEMPSTSQFVPVLCDIGNVKKERVAASSHSQECLAPAHEMPSISQFPPVLCDIGNVKKQRVAAMSHPQEFLAPAHEMLRTSENVPVLYETDNIQEKEKPKKNLDLDYDMPSTSGIAQTGPLKKRVVPLQQQIVKEKQAPVKEKVCHEFSKLQKLEKICEEQRKKIKRLREKVRRQGKKIGTLEDLIKDLKQKMIINTEQSLLLEQCGGSQDFLKRQMSKAKGLPLEKKYSEEIRKFALTLHFLSPRAYDYIRRVYNTCLPHPRTLSKWYQNVNADAGFTKEAFDTLKKTVEQNNPQKIVCALVLDEIAIRKGLTWDPKSQKYHGRVDYGHHIDCDSADEANQCLVFMLTCINGTWKLPIGYFFVTSLTGEQKSVLVETAIKMTEDTGAQVVSVTCDGPATNFSMLSALGCDVKNKEQTSFQTDNKNNVHAFIDPCHAIKLVRNTLGDLRVLIDSTGRNIEFKYLELLLNLQQQQGLHLGTKLAKAHINYEKQKMKVRLATQLFSNSVADAMLFCKTELQLEDFKDCDGTVNFINIINNVFDILNSHSIRPPGMKKAMCPSNIGFIKAFFEGAIDYLRLLKLPTGELLIESRRKTGFIGLILDMKSALKLYKDVVENLGLLKYIPMYKISQDHLELFFSSIRAKGGFNNNPNAVQFRAAYKRLLVRAEIRDGGIGNCIPLEQINILTCSSANPVQDINDLTEKSRFVEIDEDHSELYDSYCQLLANDSNKYCDSVTEYISGFVCRKLTKNLKCDICVQLLSGPENKNSLIYLKSRGGLQYASQDVINIIKKTENVTKKHLDLKKKPEQYYMYIFKFIMEFYGLDNQKVLSTDTNAEHNITHRLLLIKSIIKTYIDIRYRHFGKKATEKVSYRNYFNKLVLFRNE